MLQLNSHLKKSKELEEKVVQGRMKRNKMMTGKYEELEKFLLQWFHQAQSLQLPTNGVELTEKAQEIVKELQIKDFTGASERVERFKTRYSLIYCQICGEVESINEEDATSWKEIVLKNFSPHDVFNADEFGLFFKLTPKKSLVYKLDKCHDEKLNKERLTVLVCTNADGSEKIKLLVVGKSKTLQCFKRILSFPCDYAAQSHAWMTGEQFVLWVKELDVIF